MRSNSVSLQDDLLVTAYQVTRPGDRPAGMRVWDIADPTAPREISFFDTSGPHSRGTHFVWLADGFAHISTGTSDFQPNDPKDDQFYMIVDLHDPPHPREVGRWWLPGQRRGDREKVVRHRPPSVDTGFRLHHALVYPERPDRAYLGYIDGGIVILDITDKDAPRLVSRLDYHPPFVGFPHTVVPLLKRNLLVVADEANVLRGTDRQLRVWIVDIREETNPVPIATAPIPRGFDELRDTGGLVGPHNINENEPVPGCAKLQNTVVVAWYGAGVRVFDITDPFRPEEVAAFLPETPSGQRECRISEVFVEDRGFIYAGDRASGGVYVLEYIGERPLS